MTSFLILSASEESSWASDSAPEDGESGSHSSHSKAQEYTGSFSQESQDQPDLPQGSSYNALIDEIQGLKGILGGLSERIAKIEKVIDEGQDSRGSSNSPVSTPKQSQTKHVPSEVRVRKMQAWCRYVRLLRNVSEDVICYLE